MSNPVYLQKIQEMIDNGTLPQVGAVTVAHDAWCAIFQNKACNCTPEVKPRDLTPNRRERRANKERAK